MRPLTPCRSSWPRVIVIAAIDAFRRPEARDGFLAWMATSFGALYVALLAFMAGILVIAPAVPAGAAFANVLDAGRIWLLVLVLSVWSFDTFAYLAGRTFKRGHFLNHISPNKTWSGVIGGTVAAIVVAGLLTWAAGQNVLGGLLLGLLVAITAQSGDVAESLLKRAAGAKDSGTPHPRPRRRPRPGRLVPVRGAGRVRLPGGHWAAWQPCLSRPPSSTAPLRVALLGSTGSIGRQTLDVLEAAGPDAFRVVALAAGRDARTLEAAGGAPSSGRRRAGRCRSRGGMALPGGTLLERRPTRWSVSPPATTWTWSSWPPAASSASARVLAALRAGKVVATANKETLVAGGHLVMPLARALAGGGRGERPGGPHGQPAGLAATHRLGALRHLAVPRRRSAPRAWHASILTASGGPFRDWAAGAAWRPPPRTRRWPIPPGRWVPRSPSIRRRS